MRGPVGAPWSGTVRCAAITKRAARNGTMSGAIRFEGVTKSFVIAHDRPRSFQEAFVRVFRRTAAADRDVLVALDDVSFDVAPGTAVGLVGPNGTGKSTALKLVARIVEPSAGRVEVSGRVAALLELGAGFHPATSPWRPRSARPRAAASC